MEASILSKRVCILDYGSGNVSSVKNAFDRLGISNVISNEIHEIQESSHLVLPGVGAFSASMKKIESTLPVEYLRKQIQLGKPLLGICVGMQVFAELGFEFGLHLGLGLVAGTEAIELPPNVSKPHVGWNSIQITKEHKITMGIENGSDFYFVHSYYLNKVPKTYIIASCDYGLEFPAIVGMGNLIGVQFHPEKSQNNGDQLLKNFMAIV